MRKLEFTKMVASGNDFVILDYDLRFTNYELRDLSMQLCNRKHGIGADGLLHLSKSRKADVKMRIFNADGSEAEMCGNGARCAALFVAGCRLPVRQAGLPVSGPKKISMETKAGIINAEINKKAIRIRLTEPKDLRLGIPLRINNRLIKVNFINTGVPHAVVFVNDIDKIDVEGIGRSIRYHKKFYPKGANVNFVEVLDNNSIRVRTYERGVEGETLACGTGSVAAALISVASCHLPAGQAGLPVVSCVNVETQGKEVLKVYFDKYKNTFENVWLEGKAKKIFKGVFQIS